MIKSKKMSKTHQKFEFGMETKKLNLSFQMLLDHCYAFALSMNRDFYLDVYTILNRIKLTIWTMCAFRVLNPRQWSLAKDWKAMPQECRIKLKPNGMV